MRGKFNNNDVLTPDGTSSDFSRAKCIFVHIPRCAGTSVETWLCGRDYWTVDPARKHLTAGQARRTYAAYWGSYFKFSIVRHPFTRFGSCLKYGSHFGLARGAPSGLDFSGYHERFGREVVVEYDHRFYDSNEVAS